MAYQPKSYRKFLATSVAAAMVATVAAPLAGAEAAKFTDVPAGAWYEEAVTELAAAKVFSGVEPGKFAPLKTVTRAEAFAALSKALNLNEKDAPQHSFTDVPAGHWATPAVNALAEAGIVKGSEGKVLLTQDLTREQLASMLIRALGIEEEEGLENPFTDVPADSVYVNAIATAVKHGITNGTSPTTFGLGNKATRADLAGFLFKDTVRDQLPAWVEYQKSLVTDLAVESVAATNLKEVYVQFNQEVSAETIKDANFALTTKANAAVETTATLLEDGKTVVITVKADGAGLTNQADYKLTIDKVESASGVALEKVTKEFRAFDAALPTVEGITVTGPKSFVIEFSEPVKQGGNIQVKSGNSTISVNQTFSGYNTNKISVELYSELTDGTTYTVEVKDFEDFAGYKNVQKLVELTYVKDTTAPVATVAKAEQTYVVVDFSKPVSGLTKDHFYHTFSAWTPIGIFKDAAMTQAITTTDKVTKVYVKFAEDAENGKPISAGTTNLVIRGKVGTNEIKDNWGNAFADASIPVTVSADVTPPAISELSVKSESALTAKFSKSVTFTEDNVEVLDAEGKKIDGLNITVVQGDNDKEYTINLGKNLSGKTITVNIKNVYDKALNPNKLALHTASLEVTDKTAPSVSKVTKKFVSANDQSLYIFFDEAVNNTALVAGNYYLQHPVTGALTKLTTTPTFFSGNSVVKIDLTNAQRDLVNHPDNPHNLLVTNVQDLNGNALTGQVYGNAGILPFDDTANKPLVSKIEATGTKTLVVTFNQYLSKVDIGAFSVNGEVPTSLNVATNNDGNTVATLTLNTALTFDAKKDATTPTTLVIENASLIENVFGVTANTTIASSAYDTIDKIAPALAKHTVGGNSVDKVVSEAGKVTLTFTEAINFNTVSAVSFEVTGKTIARVEEGADATELVLILTDSSAVVAANTVVVQKAAIRDIAGNSVVNINTKVSQAITPAP